MYKVIEFFTDLQDENHAYNPGDIFPREGHEVSDDRLKELSGDKNKRGCALIKEIVTKDIVVEEAPVIEAETTEEKEDKPKKKTRKAKSSK